MGEDGTQFTIQDVYDGTTKAFFANAYVPKAERVRTMSRVLAAYRSSPQTICSWVRMGRNSLSRMFTTGRRRHSLRTWNLAKAQVTGTKKDHSSESDPTDRPRTPASSTSNTKHSHPNRNRLRRKASGRQHLKRKHRASILNHPRTDACNQGLQRITDRCDDRPRQLSLEVACASLSLDIDDIPCRRARYDGTRACQRQTIPTASGCVR